MLSAVVHGPDHDHGVVPVPVHVDDHGIDHVNVDDHDHDHVSYFLPPPCAWITASTAPPFAFMSG